MDTSQLTDAERRVWDAYALGQSVDFRVRPREPATSGAEWGPERTVRAEVLRALLVGGPRAEGEIPFLRLHGARISGRLDLQCAEVAGPIHLWACYFDEELDVYGAQLRQLNLGWSVLPGVNAIALRVDGSLRMAGCRVRGRVRLGGARIAGAVFLQGAHVGEEGVALDEPVLALNRVSIEDDLQADGGLIAHGLVSLAGAVVAGNITFDDAVLRNPGGTALHGANLNGGSDLHAARLRAYGRVNLPGVRLPGQLNLEGARLSNPGGTALRASLVAGSLYLNLAEPIEGAITLRGCQLDYLHIAPETWPDEVRLDGLTYARIGPHEPAERRLQALERDVDGYVPYAYEQLTAAYRRVGDDAAARTVQLAKQRRHRATLAWYARAWGYLQDWTVGYGFRPTRAAVWLFSLLLVGAVTFAVREPSALKPDEAPDFNPVFYSLDLLLPIVDFGQESAYAAQGAYQWFGYALVVLGWTLATTIAAGVTRAISRQ
ncbi:pentapeptide repeat-containing protein [Streptomyces kanamyceticus]|uniref:Pentapeptide repeat-containing protein n=1 Tax=Streptomyces kanamyceticus TaxID=1967 RepID=A0A5J6GEY5_STRKN|nr:pentapeptide repeat-containing protein [Streptomyces kanamyceticus]QEU94480.1 pentapeptide repeat-containing protein [Streptomyces kanamyceticus]